MYPGTQVPGGFTVKRGFMRSIHLVIAFVSTLCAGVAHAEGVLPCDETSLHGFVVSAASNVRVSNVTIRATNFIETYETTSTRYGEFLLNLPAGSYSVTLSHPVYDVTSLSLTVAQKFIDSESGCIEEGNFHVQQRNRRDN